MNKILIINNEYKCGVSLSQPLLIISVYQMSWQFCQDFEQRGGAYKDNSKLTPKISCLKQFRDAA